MILGSVVGDVQWYKKERKKVELVDMFKLNNLAEKADLDPDVMQRVNKLMVKRNLFIFEKGDDEDQHQHGRFIQAMATVFTETELSDESYPSKLRRRNHGEAYAQLKMKEQRVLHHTYCQPYLIDHNDHLRKPDFTVCDSTMELSNLNVVTMIEFYNREYEKHFARICYYNRCVLESQPMRRFIISAISDTSNIEFVKTYFANGEYVHDHMKSLTTIENLKSLFQILLIDEING